MSFNFPNSPLQGQLFTPVGGYAYIFLDGVWRVVENPQGVGTAQTRNRIVNGAMQISQENGDSGGTVNGFYPADQWLMALAGPAVTIARSASIPASGDRRIGFTVTTGKPSLAATDNFHVMQHVEGIRIVDFLWGTSGALPVVVRFWAMTTTTPGTYTLRIANGAADRTWLGAFTLDTINVWKLNILIVPGDTTGTWPTDTNRAMTISIAFAAGTTYQGSPGWQAGNKVVLTTATNGAATTNNTFFFGDVGLYLDPQNTGVAPPWQMPDEAQELAACQRYYHKIQATGGLQSLGTGLAASATVGRTTVPLGVSMRNSPAITVSAAADFVFVTAASFTPSAVGSAVANTEAITIDATVSGMTAGHGGYLRAATGAAFIAASARM